MTYADILSQTPRANRTSSDRLISPPRIPSPRGSLTPDPKRPESRLSSKSALRFSMAPLSPTRKTSSNCFKLSRSFSTGGCGIPHKLFQTNSTDIALSPRRKNSTGRNSDLSSPGSSSFLQNKRYLPSKPSHELQFSDIPSDFYISPMDWSKHDIIAFALSTELAFINPKTEEFSVPPSPLDATSVKFDNSGESLALGCEDGHLEIFDVLSLTTKSTFDLFENSTVLVSDWNEDIIVSGGRDGMMSVIDTRIGEPVIYDKIHAEEVCCVKFCDRSTSTTTTSTRSPLKNQAAPSTTSSMINHYNSSSTASQLANDDNNNFSSVYISSSTDLNDVSVESSSSVSSNLRLSLNLNLNSDEMTPFSSSFDSSINLNTSINSPVSSISLSSSNCIFATSGNDCVVKLWDMRNLNEPTLVFSQHTAAVRAIQFSPTAPNIIATGGGTSDKTIKLWNYLTGDLISSINTGSQVCNLFWNEEYNEILSTHGFSQNQLALWKGTDLSPIAQFHEHKQRVLFMAVSPDSTRVATAAPNDGMLIWKMFPSNRLSLTHSMMLLR